MFSFPSEGTNDKAGDGHRGEDVNEIYWRLVEGYPEFQHIREHEPQVGFLLREGEYRKNGVRILGTCYLPGVQGNLRPVFDWMLERTFGFFPEFLIILDAEHWRAATDRDREILMFHEMLHMGIAKDEFGSPKFHRESGEPVWAIRPHDIEEFNEVAARYGQCTPAIEAFMAAVKGEG